jgi:hypothetical protein
MLKRYPAFHRDSFAAMTDEEVQLYEERVLDVLNTPPDLEGERRMHGSDEHDTTAHRAGQRSA